MPKNAQLILSAEISVFPSMFSNSLSSARKERLQTFFPVPGTCDMSWNTQGYAPPNEHGMNPNGLLPEGQGSGLAPQEGGSGSDAGEIPRIIFYTRMLNLILGIAMIVVSLLSLLTTDNMTTGVLACYVVAFACLLCCFESGLQVVLRVIALNFGFMYSAKARSVFMLFVGSILFSFSLFGKIVGFAMLANAGFNIYAIVKYPGFEEAQRDRSTSEIKDYLADNPAFAKTFVDAGASYLAANPEVVVRGAQASWNNSQQQEAGGAVQQAHAVPVAGQYDQHTANQFTSQF